MGFTTKGFKQNYPSRVAKPITAHHPADWKPKQRWTFFKRQTKSNKDGL